MDNTYMSKETQEKRFKELIQKAEALGYTLEYDKQLDPNKRSSLWNYRYIARLKINDDISIQLDVIGDVCVDKSNSGRVGEELSAYYKSDSELYDAVKSGIVELVDNNWYEICGYYKEQFINLMWLAEDDDYLLAIKEMIDKSAEILKCIKEEIKN